MSDYFIQEETMDVLADHMRRISGTSDALSGAEITELMSRTQGTVKTTGEYQVRALNAGGGEEKSGMYDTGEVFALPKSLFNIKELITQPDGTQEYQTIAIFDGWTGTAPLGHYHVTVDDMPIDIGALYKPVDDCLVILVEFETENTTISLYIRNVREVNWGDGNVTTYDTATHTHTHTYTLAGKYMIKIPYANNIMSNGNIYADDITRLAIKDIALPKWFKVHNGFDNLTNLNYVFFENGIVPSSFSFKNCVSLKHINLPSSITSLKDDCFYMYNDEQQGGGMTSVVLPYGLTSIPNYCFTYCINLKDFAIPDTVTSIGAYTFADCTSLENIFLPNSITSIGVGAFEDCTSLKSVALPSNLTSIGGSMFHDCLSLTEVKGLDNVTNIGSRAFAVKSHTDNLLTLNLPSVTSIQDEAFHFRNYITLVLGADTVCSLGNLAITISSSNYLKVYVPDNLVDAYKIDANWSKYASCIKPLSEYIEE